MAPYFAKVECFCFEEQRLLANETVDLPILFFIDKDFLDDPSMRGVDDIVLVRLFLLKLFMYFMYLINVFNVRPIKCWKML